MKELELKGSELKPGDQVRAGGTNDLLEIQEIESSVAMMEIVIRFTNGKYAKVLKSSTIKPVYRND